jgi:hypothetical protein
MSKLFSNPLQSQSILLMVVIGMTFVGVTPFVFADTINVIEEKTVTLIGESYDFDNDELSFEWIQTSGEPVTLNNNAIPNPKFMAPSVINGDVKTLSFQFTVTDSFGASHTDNLDLMINPVNHNPTVHAGWDQNFVSTVSAITIFTNTFDEDYDILFYKWTQIEGEKINIQNSESKYLTIDSSDFGTSSVIFELTVNDGFGGVASDSVKISPFPHNPLTNPYISIDAGPMVVVNEGDAVRIDSIGKTSNDAPLSYVWVQISGDQTSIDSHKSKTLSFIAPQINTDESLLSFQVTGYSQGLGWANDIVRVKILSTNDPPVADAGMDKIAYEYTQVNLAGIGYDADGDKITQEWVQTKGTPVILRGDPNYESYFIAPGISGMSEELSFSFTVTDSMNQSDSDDATITINSIHSPPQAFAGSDKTVITNSMVTVDGFGIAPYYDTMTYEWVQTKGPMVTLDAEDTLFSFIAPDVTPNSMELLEFEFSVYNQKGQFGTDSMSVIVMPSNNAPTVNAGNDLVLDENDSTSITCVGIDMDGDTLHYTWETSDDIITISDPLNSHTTITAQNIVDNQDITLTCTANDGTESTSDYVVITINNVLSADILSSAGDDMSVMEGDMVMLDARNSYDPEGQTLSYEWNQLSGELVELSSTSHFTAPLVLNGETKSLVFEVTVYDDNNRTSTDTITVTVYPVNSVPEASATAQQ